MRPLGQRHRWFSTHSQTSCQGSVSPCPTLHGERWWRLEVTCSCRGVPHRRGTLKLGNWRSVHLPLWRERLLMKCKQVSTGGEGRKSLIFITLWYLQRDNLQMSHEIHVSSFQSCLPFKHILLRRPRPRRKWEIWGDLSPNKDKEIEA